MSGVGLVTTLMLRESPVWLLSKGRDAEAKASLRSFRANASSEELDLMLDGMRTTDDGTSTTTLAVACQASAKLSLSRTPEKQQGRQSPSLPTASLPLAFLVCGARHSTATPSLPTTATPFLLTTAAMGPGGVGFGHAWVRAGRLLLRFCAVHPRFPGGEAAKGGLAALFGDKTNRKALFIGIGLMLVQQLSGINAIMFYSGTILQTVASSSAEANTYATGMQGLQVVVTFCSAFFMDRAGRVPILLFAATGMVVSTYVLAYYYIFTDGMATSTRFGPFSLEYVLSSS